MDSGDGHSGLPKRSQDEKLEEVTELIRKAIDGTEATLNAVKKRDVRLDDLTEKTAVISSWSLKEMQNKKGQKEVQKDKKKGKGGDGSQEERQKIQGSQAENQKHV